MAQKSGEAYKSLSSLALLVRRTVPELNALMEGPLIKPYFDHFYKEWLEPRRQSIMGVRARSIRTTRPSLQTVQQYITVGERDGKQTYTSAYPNRVNWTETDYYAELLERIYQQNCKNRNGLFFGSATVDRDAAYSIVWQIIRRLVENSRTSRHVPFSAAPGDSPTVGIRPLVVFWKNVNDGQHGWYHESNRPEESIFYAEDPTAYATLDVFKSAISANFQLHIPGRAIAKLHQVRYTNDGVVTELLTESLWTQIQIAKRGSDHQVTLFLETQSQETGENINDEDDLDPHNPASVSEIFLTNMELRGNMDEAYISMIQERETNNITPRDRFGRYTILLGVASMTNQSPLGDVAMQRDGNDEEAVIEAANDSSLAWAMELEEAEGGAANTQRAAAIGAKLFGEITEEEVKAFRARERWTDNTKFQREDFERSCNQLNITTPDLLRVEGMLPALELKKHQVIGAAWILRMLDTNLRGCCLADSVGLGKTVTTLAMIQHRYNMREREPAQRVREAKYGSPKPILIVVPSSLVMQWANETNKYLPKFRVVVYYGTVHGGEDGTRFLQKTTLTNTCCWFGQKDEANARTIIISSYGRIFSRHGPTELKKWRLSRAGFNPGRAEAAENDFSIQDPEWPNDLRDKFQMVIIDEAHHIKSAERSNTFVALSWFRARLKLAITATPTINRIDDFGGILSFLEPEGLWEPQQLQSWGVTNDVNPFQNCFNNHPASVLRCTVKCFNKFILRSRDERERANLLEKIYSICVLKRNYASRIPFHTGVPIGEDIPPMQVRTVELKFSPRELDRYIPMHNAALSCLTKIIDDSSGKKRVVFDMQIWRALSHFATWIGFEHCLDIKGDDLQEYRNSDFNLQDLITKICAENPTLPPLQTPDESGILSWFAQWSPKLRYFSYLIAEICIKRCEKIVIWVGSP